MLDLDDCPPHNICHDISHYPKYYTPLYYPELFPEVFATFSSVKEWLETSLSSHMSMCDVCSSQFLMLGVTFCVCWREPRYLLCSYSVGKVKQCSTVSMETLQSSEFSYCAVVPKLCEPSSVVSSFGSSPSPWTNIYNDVLQEEPPIESLLGFFIQKACLYNIHLYDLFLLKLPRDVAKVRIQTSVRRLFMYLKLE